MNSYQKLKAKIALLEKEKRKLNIDIGKILNGDQSTIEFYSFLNLQEKVIFAGTVRQQLTFDGFLKKIDDGLS
jgi:hypothetical protein